MASCNSTSAMSCLTREGSVTSWRRLTRSPSSTGIARLSGSWSRTCRPPTSTGPWRRRSSLSPGPGAEARSRESVAPLKASPPALGCAGPPVKCSGEEGPCRGDCVLVDATLEAQTTSILPTSPDVFRVGPSHTAKHWLPGGSPRRRRRDGGAGPYQGLVLDAARPPLGLAHQPEDHGGRGAGQPLPHAPLVGTPVAPNLQRRLPARARPETPRLARRSRRHHVGRNLGRRRPHGPGRAERRPRDVERAPPALHQQPGLYRGDLPHLLL